MRSATPKVLHEVAGRTLLGHVLAAVTTLDPDHVVVVVGHGREQVSAYLADVAPGAVVVVQERQNGTGHAVRVALCRRRRKIGGAHGVKGEAARRAGRRRDGPPGERIDARELDERGLAVA